MRAPYRSGDGQRQADSPACKQADMQPRRQAGGHAASDARGHPQDGPWFAGQAQRGKPDPADGPALGAGGTASLAGTGALEEPPRSRGQFLRGRQGQRGAIQLRRLAWDGLEGAARPSIPMRRIGRGRRRRGAMPPTRPHANLGSATGGGEFA
jgi:hypothetical protein